VRDNKGAITAHFIAYWGVPSEIRERDVPGLEAFAILEFPPSGTRREWRYATNGMSSFLQSHSDPKISVRTELYACTQHKAPWLDELLSALAGYPRQQQTFFAEWDTVEVSHPIDHRISSFTGIMLVPPGPFDPLTIGIAGGVMENILIHQLAGLTPSEVQYARQNGGRLLWGHILKSGRPFLDQRRSSVI
jgi:hypothetical protein